MKPLSDIVKLTAIKLVHTLVWLVFVTAILYVCYAGAFNKVNRLVWFCIGIVITEGFVLLINKWRCPLTSLACKYTNVHPVGFDIFLPKWLAKHNKILFSTIFLIGLLLVLWRTMWPVINSTGVLSDFTCGPVLQLRNTHTSLNLFLPME